ncbi:MAG: phosphodiester glycosidase family protein [Candidatus Hydrogenedentes bacterium]|nr:phosphodiester glycosidase family protein [Candidatus Hydrogenedentota bacterium]
MAGRSGGDWHSLCALGVVLLVACFSGFAEEADAKPAGDAALLCEKQTFRHVDYDVVRVDLQQADLRLFWKDSAGEPIKNFRRLQNHLKTQGLRALFAINSGIYARDHTPLGLHVENGQELEPLNRKRGGGNFFLKPNGVFYIDAAGGHIAETEAFAGKAPEVRLAVQSGPLLLDRGKIHPVFEPESDSRHIRNGVGIVNDHTIIFAITHFPVNLYDFASFFKEAAACSDALYLDGAISGMFAPGCGRNDTGAEYVGMLAIVEPAAGVEDHGEE